jgi:hypothetical protein
VIGGEEGGALRLFAGEFVRPAWIKTVLRMKITSNENGKARENKKKDAL